MTTKTATERAREWLRRNQLGRIEPSALLVERLEARRRGNWITFGTVMAYTAIFTILSDLAERSRSDSTPDESDVSGLAWSVLTPVVIILAWGAGLWYSYRAERRLLGARRTRTAHPAAARVARVLGPRYLAVVLVVHGGGLLLGAATALLASRPVDRALALAFLGSIAVLATLFGLVLAGVLRRPSVAEDSDSLLVDDVLRTQDARAAVVPLPILVALVAALGDSTVGSWLIWSLLGYAVLGAACWVAAEVAGHLTRSPAGVVQ
ncbi:MAG TPA: hypothetical protein VGR06_11470 [Actinophytocola sp.]|jgi:hypothetical protein|uniref:hypothetical protein n=1 Tax=Actinophytocola sp. TaxID=1872138 RepID=UPI002DF87273|nr:hypothetical protein [Actinophytocola sp.]